MLLVDVPPLVGVVTFVPSVVVVEVGVVVVDVETVVVVVVVVSSA